MSEQSIVEIAVWVLGALFTLIAVLINLRLSRLDKDNETLTIKHKADVDMLWGKMETNREELNTLRERVIGRHYEKSELDLKFAKLEDAFREGFHDFKSDFEKFGAKLDTMALEMHRRRGKDE